MANADLCKKLVESLDYVLVQITVLPFLFCPLPLPVHPTRRSQGPKTTSLIVSDPEKLHFNPKALLKTLIKIFLHLSGLCFLRGYVRFPTVALSLSGTGGGDGQRREVLQASGVQECSKHCPQIPTAVGASPTVPFVSLNGSDGLEVEKFLLLLADAEKALAVSIYFLKVFVACHNVHERVESTK